jgi:hypothetical protein
MFEKSILVVYLNIDNLSLKDAFNSTQSTIHYLEKEFNDDSNIKCIVVPVRNQPTKIELLNSKYPNWQEFQERLPELIQQMENFKNDNDI